MRLLSYLRLLTCVLMLSKSYIWKLIIPLTLILPHNTAVHKATISSPVNTSMSFHFPCVTYGGWWWYVLRGYSTRQYKLLRESALSPLPGSSSHGCHQYTSHTHAYLDGHICSILPCELISLGGFSGLFSQETKWPMGMRGCKLIPQRRDPVSPISSCIRHSASTCQNRLGNSNC